MITIRTRKTSNHLQAKGSESDIPPLPYDIFEVEHTPLWRHPEEQVGRYSICLRRRDEGELTIVFFFFFSAIIYSDKWRCIYRWLLTYQAGLPDHRR